MRLSGRRAAAFLAASVALGCGQTSHGPQKAQLDVTCDDVVELRPLDVLSEAATDVQLSPCGELSFREAGQLLLTDTSLQRPQALAGAGAEPLRFDPLGRGVAYRRVGDASELVHQGLRDGQTWTAPLGSDVNGAAPLFDFYAHDGQSSLFACVGFELHDYADGPAAERVVQLDMRCDGPMYSAVDGLLLGWSPTLTSVDIHGGRQRPLTEAGVCDTDLCDVHLVGRVFVRDGCNQVPAGDTFMCPAFPTRYYDARSGAALPADPLMTPDRRIVAATQGKVQYLAPDRTSALTLDPDHDAKRTTVRYYGPEPTHPQRWLEAAGTIATDATLLSRLSPDAQRIALWSSDCFGYPPAAAAVAVLFTPGGKVEPLDVAGCLSRVHWVGSDGALLATLIPKVSPSGFFEDHLVLIRADRSITQLEIKPQNLGDAVSDGTVLVAPVRGATTGLLIVDLATGRAELRSTPPVNNLLVDRSRRRLVFEVQAQVEPPLSQLWGGAFPRLD